MAPQTDILALLQTIVPKPEQGLLLPSDGNPQTDFKQLLLASIESGQLKKIIPSFTDAPSNISDKVLSTLISNDDVQLNIQNVLDYLNQSKNEVKTVLSAQAELGKDLTEKASDKPAMADDLIGDIPVTITGLTINSPTMTIVKTTEVTTEQVIRTYNPDRVPEITWKSSNGQVNEAVVKWHVSGVELHVSVKLDLDKNSLIISLPETRTNIAQPAINQTDMLNLQRDFKEHMTSNVSMNIIWSSEKNPIKSEFTQQDFEGRQSQSQSQHQQQRRQQKQPDESHVYKEA